MCLNINKNAVIITAEEDIVVYKFIKRLDKFNGVNYNVAYNTPFRGSNVKIGETYTSELLIDWSSYYSSSCNRKYRYKFIDVGLHSFPSLRSVRKFIETHYLFSSNILFAKCIIPKGSKYCKGKFNDYPALVSDTITYIETIERY